MVSPGVTRPFAPALLDDSVEGNLLLEAYIDPGSGSLILQALVGGMAAAGVVARLYWRRLRSFFSRESASE